ncbi:MAG: hypothetical protein Q8R40_02920 [bacterium]|nr:hypothetical protein [bacterium]
MKFVSLFFDGILKIHRKSRGIFFIIVPIALVICGEFIWLAYVSVSKDFSATAYSMGVLSECSQAGSREACYDKAIPRLMDTISMEQAFEVTREIQKEDPAYAYCHVLGHNISSRETKKDPSKWLDVIARCPTTMCNNGCMHGAMMQRFQSESLDDSQIEAVIPDIANACEPRGNWHPREVERSMCYHGLGHLFMYVTRADLNTSSSLCERVGEKEDGRSYVQTCIQGVFMQMFQPLEAEDFALVEGKTPKKEDMSAFCAAFSGEKRVACHNESWPLFREEIEQPEGTTAFCSFSRDPLDQSKCYGTALSYLTVLFAIDQKNVSKLEHFCNGLVVDRRGECFGFAAARLVQVDPALTSTALDVCSRAVAAGYGDACFKSLADFGIQSFLPGSSELKSYCERMPNQWSRVCFQR